MLARTHSHANAPPRTPVPARPNSRGRQLERRPRPRSLSLSRARVPSNHNLAGRPRSLYQPTEFCLNLHPRPRPRRLGALPFPPLKLTSPSRPKRTRQSKATQSFLTTRSVLRRPFLSRCFLPVTSCVVQKQAKLKGCNSIRS